MKILLFLLSLVCANAYAVTAPAPPASISTSTSTAPASTCILQLSKSNAWAAYDVKIVLYDFDNQKQVAVFDLAKGTPQQRPVSMITTTFDCVLHHKIIFAASVSPKVWQDDQNQIYWTEHFWELSGQVASSSVTNKKVEVVVRFPEDFVNVPDIVPGVD